MYLGRPKETSTPNARRVERKHERPLYRTLDTPGPGFYAEPDSQFTKQQPIMRKSPGPGPMLATQKLRSYMKSYTSGPRFMSPTKTFYLKVVRESAEEAGRAREAAAQLQKELRAILS